MTAHAASTADENNRRGRLLALYKEYESARDKLSMPWYYAESMLEGCAQAKQMSYRADTCATAQKRVDECNAVREDWRKRKQALLAELDQAQPGIGQQYTPGISPLRGIGRQADLEEKWNDSIKALRNMDIAACPSTLPGTSLTPGKALELWVKEEADAAAIIIRCDGLSRDLAGVLDAEDADRATGLLAQLESTCSRENPNYAERAARARERLAALRAARSAATPPRKTGFAASLAQGAISQAEDDAKDPEAARRRKAEEAQRSAAERQAITQRDAENVARINSGLQSMLNSVLTNPGGGIPSAAAMLKQSVAPEYSGLVNGTQQEAGLDPAAGVTQATGTASASSSGGGNCATEYNRQEAEFGAINQRGAGSTSATAAYQRVLYVTSERLKLLKQYCQGQPQFNEYASVRQAYDNALRGCQRTAGDPSQCGPRVP